MQYSPRGEVGSNFLETGKFDFRKLRILAGGAVRVVKNRDFFEEGVKSFIWVLVYHNEHRPRTIAHNFFFFFHIAALYFSLDATSLDGAGVRRLLARVHKVH